MHRQKAIVNEPLRTVATAALTRIRRLLYCGKYINKSAAQAKTLV